MSNFEGTSPFSHIKAVACISAIVCSFAFVFVYIVSILWRRKEIAVFICHFFLHKCTYLTFDLTVTLG